MRVRVRSGLGKKGEDRFSYQESAGAVRLLLKLRFVLLLLLLQVTIRVMLQSELGGDQCSVIIRFMLRSELGYDES